MLKSVCILLAAVLLSPAAARAATCTHRILTYSAYGPIVGTSNLKDDGSRLTVDGGPTLVAGQTGAVDFKVVTKAFYCSDPCGGWPWRGPTEFYDYDDTYPSATSKGVESSNPATWATDYLFDVSDMDWGGCLNGLDGSDAKPRFHDYDTTSRQVAAAVPEPATWAMMLLGFVGLGYSGLARRAP